MFNFLKKNIYLVIPVIIIFILVMNFMYMKIVEKKLNIHNGCDQRFASFIKRSKLENRYKVTFCDKYDKNKIKIISDHLEEYEYVFFDYIGNPNSETTKIYFEDASKHKVIISGLKIRGDSWTKQIAKVPDNMNGEIKLVAEDSSTIHNGWLGIGNIIVKKSIFSGIYLKTFFYIFLFSLYITLIFNYFLKKQDILKAYINMSLFFGISSLSIFYLYIYSSFLGLIISAFYGVFIFYTLSKMNFQNFCISLKLFIFLLSLMSIIIFFSYGSLDNFINLNKNVQQIENMLNFQTISAHLWHYLPIDNWIPKFFANALYNGHLPMPTIADYWLSSDRPPLQTGFYLLFSIISISDLSYFVFSIGMQVLVIIFIIIFLMYYVKNKNYILFMGFLILFNGFIFVNSLFFWPKLLSALFQGIAFYYVYKLWYIEIRLREYYILFGIFSTLAFLSHGGSIFYLLSLAVLLLFTLKNRDDIKKLFSGLFVSLLLYIPWALYQKLLDPPGDRLLKIHLAHYVEETDKSFLEILVNYYSNLSLTSWLNIQRAHIEKIYDSFYFHITDFFTLSDIKIRSSIFHNSDYSFLFFSIFLFFLYFLMKMNDKNIKSVTKLFGISYILYTLIWSLLLATSTILHQGAYFSWFSGFIFISLIVLHINKWIFYLLGSLNLILFFKLYILSYLATYGSVCVTIFILSVLNYFIILRYFIGIEIKRSESL